MINWTLPEGDTHFAEALKRTPEGFELDHLECALKHVKKFHLAVDGGAHIGTWSYKMGMYFERVLAFEPDVINYRCLVSNLQLVDNLLERPSHVATFNCALGERYGMGAIVADPKRPNNSGAKVLAPEAVGLTKIVPIDHLCIDELDFLKLDVEGHELLALKGALNTIKRDKPTIMVELKEFDPPRHGGTKEVHRYLDWLGYEEVDGIRNDRVFLPKG